MKPLTTFLLLASLSYADQTGSLSGSVRTREGAPLPHLVLMVSGPAGNRPVVTGLEGRYRAEGLPPGGYTVSIDQPGFALDSPARADVGDGPASLDLVVAHVPVREQVVVSATRSEVPLSTLGIAVGVLDRQRIADRQASALLPLLQDLPGVSVARTGPPGAQGSTFIRGGASNSARVLVDGVPANEPGGAYNFGTALPLELERVEVVRGAASSLYGTDALAGVIHVVTRRADEGERAGVHAEAEGGSFDWWRGAGGASGRSGTFDWNAGLARLETDNETPNSAFAETAGALSAGASLGEATALRLTFRGENTDAGTPGQTAFGRPDEDASFERDAFVTGARLRRGGDRMAHELRVGYAKTAELSLDPLDSGTLHAELRRNHRRLRAVRLPQPGGLPERHAAPVRRLSARGPGRTAAPRDRGGRAGARDGRAGLARGAAALAGAHQRRPLPAGPGRPRGQRVPHRRRPP
jgi:iron complex outermembrane receptor protein/vitamin B12 transporter